MILLKPQMLLNVIERLEIMSNIFLLLYFGGFCYFLFKIITKKENRALNGFSAGVFLVIFVFRAAPFFVSLVRQVFFQ